MIPQAAPVVVGGGSVALLGWAVYYLVKLILDYRASRGETVSRSAEKRAGDTEWLIEELRASLKDEREDNQATAAEIAELRTQNSHLYQQMREQRKSYEAEITQLRTEYEATVTELRERLQELTAQVEAFQQRLHGPRENG